MLERKSIFPHVIEINNQAGHLIGCCVYLVHDQDEWVLIDIGYEESVDEIIDLIRQLDLPLSECRGLIATHADDDHIQGMAGQNSCCGQKYSLTRWQSNRSPRGTSC